MATPFDRVATVDFAPAGQSFAAPITRRQRTVLRSMALEKADLIGKDLVQADDLIDAWLADMTAETASRAIAKLAQWLDGDRARRGIARFPEGGRR
jgi:hypothetical protein